MSRNRVQVEIGQVFGMLTVKGINTDRTYLCQCECGLSCNVSGSYLKSGKVKTCNKDKKCTVKMRSRTISLNRQEEQTPLVSGSVSVRAAGNARVEIVNGKSLSDKQYMHSKIDESESFSYVEDADSGLISLVFKASA